METSKLICRAYQLTGSYMMRTMVVKGLNQSWRNYRKYEILLVDAQAYLEPC